MLRGGSYCAGETQQGVERPSNTVQACIVETKLLFYFRLTNIRFPLNDGNGDRSSKDHFPLCTHCLAYGHAPISCPDVLIIF